MYDVFTKGRRGLLGLAGALCWVGAAMALGRQREFEALSPPDLVFFAQSAASAARGDGFVQSALRFDDGALLHSVHLSPYRLVHALTHALWRHPFAAVAAQGALLGPVFLALRALLGRQIPPAGAALLALALSLHPLCLSVLLCDLRPITAMLPGGLLAAVGLRARRPGVALALGLLGGLLCAAAREEGPFVCLGLLPMALLRLRGAGRRAALAGGIGLLVAIFVGFIGPQLAWGHASNIAVNAALGERLAAVLSGEAPVFRWPVERDFGLRALLGAPTAPLSALGWPAAGAWLGLAVASGMEPMAPLHGGLHYLAVVAPGWLGGAALGLARWLPGRLGHRPARRATGLGLAMLGLSLTAGAPEWGAQGRWLLAGLGWRSARAAALDGLIAPIRAAPGPAVLSPTVAPALALLPELHLQGHLQGDPDTLRDTLPGLGWAVLDEGLAFPDPAEAAAYAAELGRRGCAPDGPPAEGLQRWRCPPAPK